MTAGRHAMAPWTKVAVDERVSEQELLGLVGRLEALHLPFLASRRPVRVLSSIVEVATLPVLDIRQHLSLRRDIAPELIGHDHTRHILQAPVQGIQSLAARDVRPAHGMIVVPYPLVVPSGPPPVNVTIPRDLLRCRYRHNQPVPAPVRRSRFTKAARIALGIMQAA
jgi:hypothetical protein